MKYEIRYCEEKTATVEAENAMNAIEKFFKSQTGPGIKILGVISETGDIIDHRGIERILFMKAQGLFKEERRKKRR